MSFGEFVKCDLNGHRDVEAPPDLVAEADMATHGVQRILLPPVALHQAALDGLPGVVGESEGDTFRDIVVSGQLEGVLPPVLRVHRVGDQEHNAVDGDFGPHDEDELSDVHRADVGRRLEFVRAVFVGRGSHLNARCIGQRPQLLPVE